MALVVFDDSGPLSLFSQPTREFFINEEKITVKQDWHNNGVAAVVWDASVVLSVYLCKVLGEKMKGARVIELGAGIGVVGITTARLGAFTAITDKDEFIHITKTNVRENLSKNETYIVKSLDWGKNLDEWTSDGETWDYVLGADIIYIEETFDDLLKTLRTLAVKGKTKVLLACKIRYERDTRFIEEMKLYFEVNQLHYEKAKDVVICEGVLRGNPLQHGSDKSEL